MFQALVLEKNPVFSAIVREVDDSFLPEGDVTIDVDVLHAQLQGRAGHHQQVAGGAQLADGGRHRRRRAPWSTARRRAWKPGDAVVLNGFGVGETHKGCLARQGAAEGRSG